MRLDPNLVREILLQLEGGPPIDDHGWPKLDLPGRTDAEISYHVRIMHDALLIEAHDVTTAATPPGQFEWRATGSHLEGSRVPRRGARRARVEEGTCDGGRRVRGRHALGSLSSPPRARQGARTMKARPKGKKYRNLYAVGEAIYYERVLDGKRVKFSTQTADWEKAVETRDRYEQRRLEREASEACPRSATSRSATSTKTPRTWQRLRSATASMHFAKAARFSPSSGTRSSTPSRRPRCASGGGVRSSAGSSRCARAAATSTCSRRCWATRATSSS
jgi:hypothetical protein